MATATAQPVMVERLPRSRSSRLPPWEKLTPLLLIAPSVILIAVFVYGFIGATVRTSLVRWNSALPDYTFVGLHNYQRLFQLDRFQADLVNTLHFTAIFLAGCIVLGLGAAVLLDQRLRGTLFFQNVYMYPLALSFVVTGTVWRWILNPNSGVNVILGNLHLDFLKSGWLTDPNTALNSLGIAAVWQSSGFVMAMFLAGLRGIPEEVREAARVDGASEHQIYRRILIPMLGPVFVSTIVLLGYLSLKVFDLVFVTTRGGPDVSSDFPSIFLFDSAFKSN